MIDFSTIPQSDIEHFLGGEGVFSARIFNDGLNKILMGTLESGCSIGMHCHDTSSEIIYVLEGKGKMLLKDGEEILKAGDCHYCKKGESHSFTNPYSEPLVFFAVVPQQ